MKKDYAGQLAGYQLCGLGKMTGVVLRQGSYICFEADGVVILITLCISTRR